MTTPPTATAYFPVRPCMGCGKYDDHPRVVRGLSDGSTVYWHDDCAAMAGDPALAWLVAHKGDLVGHAWREHKASLHEAMSPEQLDLPPEQRQVVASHRDGRTAKGRKGQN